MSIGEGNPLPAAQSRTLPHESLRADSLPEEVRQQVISFVEDGSDLAGIGLSSKANMVNLQPGFWQPRKLMLAVKDNMLGYYITGQPGLFARLQHITLKCADAEAAGACVVELRLSAPGLRSLEVSSALSRRTAAGLPSGLTQLFLRGTDVSQTVVKPQLRSLTNLQHLTLEGSYKVLDPCFMPPSLTQLRGCLDLRSCPESASQLSRLSNLQHLVLDHVIYGSFLEPDSPTLPHLPVLQTCKTQSRASSADMWMPTASVGGLYWTAGMSTHCHTALVRLHIDGAHAVDILQPIFDEFRGLKSLTFGVLDFPRQEPIYVLVHQHMSCIALGLMDNISADIKRLPTMIFKSLHPSPHLLSCVKGNVLWQTPATYFAGLYES